MIYEDNGSYQLLHDGRVVAVGKDGIGEPAEGEPHHRVRGFHVTGILEIQRFGPVRVQRDPDLTWNKDFFFLKNDIFQKDRPTKSRGLNYFSCSKLSF